MDHRTGNVSRVDYLDQSTMPNKLSEFPTRHFTICLKHQTKSLFQKRNVQQKLLDGVALHLDFPGQKHDEKKERPKIESKQYSELLRKVYFEFTSIGRKQLAKY
jgi:hypothetical protein